MPQILPRHKNRYICSNLKVKAVTAVHIEDNTPEERLLLDLIEGHKSVTIEPKESEAWRKAIATGAVRVDTFFDDLNSRINNWPATRA